MIQIPNGCLFTLLRQGLERWKAAHENPTAVLTVALIVSGHVSRAPLLQVGSDYLVVSDSDSISLVPFEHVQAINISPNDLAIMFPQPASSHAVLTEPPTKEGLA